MNRITSFGRTDTGRRRRHNEDSFAILQDRSLFIVADGMGGHRAGEVASRMAIEAVINQHSPEQIAAQAGHPESIRRHLIESFQIANQEVFDEGIKKDGLEGMGTTLITLLIDDDQAHICHVGDVRCYVYHQGKLRQITTDHSLAAERAERGEDSPVPRNIVTRGIGLQLPTEPDCTVFPLVPGARILLCSDGLWGMLSDPEIAAILGAADSPETACDLLVNAANSAGGRDNITTVIIFKEESCSQQ